MDDSDRLLRLTLAVRDLTLDDLAACDWAGTPHHLLNVARQLDRVRSGEVDYLAVCLPSGAPVAKGGVDYAVAEDAGWIWQLAVHPALRSCGIGTFLVRAAEARVRARSRPYAELAVEDSNPRAHALYSRLGYLPVRRHTDVWHEPSGEGTFVRREAECTVLRRELNGAG